MFKILISAAISMGLCFQVLDTPVPAVAASCKTSGGQSGTLKHSGQTNGTSAKVCGNELWKLVGKPKISKKPAKPRKPVTWKNEFTVKPDRPKIGVLPGTNLSVGEPADFASLASNHTRNRLLLWYPAQVKFVPTASSWSFGDGTDASGNKVTHAFSNVGVFKVQLKVTFSVTYRIIGRSSWVKLPGGVTALSSPVTVTVGSKVPLPNSAVSLVHWNCIQKPTALGC
jgi:hypothetical protein